MDLRPSLASVRQVCLLAGLYYVAARAGFQLAHSHDSAALIWPPSGIALAFVFLYGRRLWPGVALGAFASTLASGAGWLLATGVAAGNAAEAVLGAWLLARAGFRPSLTRLADVGILLAGAIVITSVGASVAAAVLALGALPLGGSPGAMWLLWWLGDLGGVVAVGSLVFLAARGRPAWPLLLRNAEFWAVLFFAAGSAFLSYRGLLPGIWGILASVAPFPFMVWAGSRLGSRGAITVAFAVTTVMVWGTGQGTGPLAFTSGHHAMLMLWGIGFANVGIALALAGAMGQRDDAEALAIATERSRTVERERARIAQEMHDGIGSQLTSLISLLERDRASPQFVAAALRQSLDEMRVVMDSLDPGAERLASALAAQRRRLAPLLRRNGVALLWEVDDAPSLERLGPEASLHLQRIVQEATSNVIRHAGAKHMEVRLEACPDEDAAELTIRDDGCGIEPTASEGRGLRNMQARADAMGAELRLLSSSLGTELTLRVPLAADASGSSPG